MQLDPKQLSRGERYKLLTGVIIPRPIAFVSTLSPDGVPNLAPYSFFSGAGADPMALMFCPTTKDDGTDKDTLRNLLPEAEGGLGEFVVNASVLDHAREVNAAAANLPADVSEFSLTGLTPAKSAVVRPPRVAECPVSFECRTLQVIRLAPGVPTSGVVVIGEVVHVWVDDALVGERMHIDAERLAPLARLAGGLYSRITETFKVPRGEDALTAELPFQVPKRER
ncbi:MAG: flavin reductase (DIM6/NTAB) family NADH-FMN oxidoreductase RutF [Myxococcota bacterium]|jgi:flavin reductase (DIM6/NTAB) family NADH-FMN oxidoreductase RutF